MVLLNLIIKHFEGEAGDDDCSLQFSCLFLKYFPITSQYILCTIGLFSLIGNGIILGTILTKDCFISKDSSKLALILVITNGNIGYSNCKSLKT